MQGSTRQLASAAESTWGTMPSGAFNIDRFLMSAKFQTPRSPIISEEAVSDRSIERMVLGAKPVRATLPFELTFGSFRRHLAATMFNPWVAAADCTMGAATVTTVALTCKLTASTGTPFTGIIPGMWVKLSGFLTVNIGMNGFHRVTGATDTELTFGDEIGRGVFVDASTVSSVTVRKMSYIKTGITPSSLYQEFAYVDSLVPGNSAWFGVGGLIGNALSLSMKPNAIITGNFEMYGKAVEMSKTQLAASYSAKNSENGMLGSSLSSGLYVDSTLVGIATGIDYNLANGLVDEFGLFNGLSPFKLSAGRSNLTGSMSVHMTDESYWTDFDAETEFAMYAKVMNPEGLKGLVFDTPKLKFSNWDEQVTEANVINTLSFQALKSTTPVAATNWIITELE